MKNIHLLPLSWIRQSSWRTLILFGLLLGSFGTVYVAKAMQTDDEVVVEQTTIKPYLYFPLLLKEEAGTVPPTATPQTPTATPVTPTATPVTPTATPNSGGIILNRNVKTASASTAVDANGGYHSAYIHYLPDVEHPPAVYGYCANNCNQKSNWKEIKLLDNTREVQLAVTAAGQPRLLVVTASTVYNGGKDYYYAACDNNCTQRGNWNVTLTFSSWGTDISDIGNDSTPQRSFALDPQGRPRFVYQDRNYFYLEPDHYGSFYAYCDSNCNSSASWHETEVGRFINYDAEIFDLPSLTFTSSGQPRVISRVFAKNDDGSSAPEGLYYYECNSGCDKTNNWHRVFIVPTGGGSYPYPGWDIELDAQNRPRVALFTGTDLDPESFERRLLYLWCNSDCLNVDNWEFNNVGLDRGYGESPDLELTAQGKPRIAFLDTAGDLGYSWCSTACESSNAQWQSGTVETEEYLRQEFPQAIPFNCDSDVWVGLAPVMALDAAGNPRIAYDLSVEARCLYDDPDDNQPPYYRFMPVWRAARLIYFEQPQ